MRIINKCKFVISIFTIICIDHLAFVTRQLHINGTFVGNMCWFTIIASYQYFHAPYPFQHQIIEKRDQIRPLNYCIYGLETAIAHMGLSLEIAHKANFQSQTAGI